MKTEDKFSKTELALEKIVYEIKPKMTIAVIGTKGKQVVFRDKSQSLYVTIKSMYIVDTDPDYSKSHFRCLI